MSDPYPFIHKNNRVAGNHSPKTVGSSSNKPSAKEVPYWPGRVQKPPPRPPAYLMGAGGELVANEAYIPPTDAKSNSASPLLPRPKNGARLATTATRWLRV